MKTLVSPLLVRLFGSQADDYAQDHIEQCIELLQKGMYNYIKQSALKQREDPTDPQLMAIATSVASMIIKAVESVDVNIQFLAEDVNPFDVFYTNMHKEYHEYADTTSGNHYAYPVVSDDLTSLYFLFKGYHSPIKVLDLRQEGDRYIIEPINKLNTSVAKIIEMNQHPVSDMKSLCYHVRGEELLVELEEHRKMEGMFGKILEQILRP